jgi:hypothetical protein
MANKGRFIFGGNMTEKEWLMEAVIWNNKAELAYRRDDITEYERCNAKAGACRYAASQAPAEEE